MLSLGKPTLKKNNKKISSWKVLKVLRNFLQDLKNKKYPIVGLVKCLLMRFWDIKVVGTKLKQITSAYLVLCDHHL